MTEAATHYFQLGRQAVRATPVAATLGYPVEPGAFSWRYDRVPSTVLEDFGVIGRELAGRGSYGVGRVPVEFSSELRFDDCAVLVEMTLAGDPTITGSGPYVASYAADQTSSTVAPYTCESSDGAFPWRITGVLGEELSIGFDSLAAGESSAWDASFNGYGVAVDDSPATVLGVPADARPTVLGEYTRIYEGSTATAFDALAELGAHLVQYRLTITDPKPARPLGDGSLGDGRRRREARVSALLKLSAAGLTATWDEFIASYTAGERNWRILATGPDGRELVIDHRLRFHDVHVDPDGRDGERLIAVDAVVVGELGVDVTSAEPLPGTEILYEEWLWDANHTNPTINHPRVGQTGATVWGQNSTVPNDVLGNGVYGAEGSDTCTNMNADAGSSGVEVGAGVAVEFSGYLFPYNTDIRIFVEWFSDADASLGQDLIAYSAAWPSAWTAWSATITSPAGTAWFKLRAMTQASGGVGATCWIDQVRIWQVF